MEFDSKSLDIEALTDGKYSLEKELGAEDRAAVKRGFESNYTDKQINDFVKKFEDTPERGFLDHLLKKVKSGKELNDRERAIVGELMDGMRVRER